jgi:hypothetical protein
MALTLEPTGLASSVDKDRNDYAVLSGIFIVGRIYEERGAPTDLRWFWVINSVGCTTLGRQPSRPVNGTVVAFG